MKKALLFVAGLAVAASAAFAEPAETLYGIGEPFGGWSANTGVELEKVSDGVFKYEGTLSGYFGFASKLGEKADDWATLNANRYNPDGGQKLNIGENQMRFGGQDSSWQATAGEYTLTIDTNNMVLTVAEVGEVEKIITWGIHGNITGDPNWATVELKEDAEDSWSAVINVTDAGNFGVKEMTNGSQSDWYSAVGGYTFDADNTTVSLVNEGGENLTFGYPVPGDYKFVFVPSTKTLTVTPEGESGIASIESNDNAVAKYFNLQGVQVANPENGLYIVVKGNKTSKVLVK